VRGCTHKDPNASDMRRKLCSHYTDAEMAVMAYNADTDLRWIEEDASGTSKT